MDEPFAALDAQRGIHALELLRTGEDEEDGHLHAHDRGAILHRTASSFQHRPGRVRSDTRYRLRAREISIKNPIRASSSWKTSYEADRGRVKAAREAAPSSGAGVLREEHV